MHCIKSECIIIHYGQPNQKTEAKQRQNQSNNNNTANSQNQTLTSNKFENRYLNFYQKEQCLKKNEKTDQKKNPQIYNYIFIYTYNYVSLIVSPASMLTLLCLIVMAQCTMRKIWGNSLVFASAWKISGESNTS